MKTLILAGGSGTRLWPVSRDDHPKQFLKLGGGASLLQKTLQRSLKCGQASDVFILTNKQYLHEVRRQVQEIDEAIAKNILLEPSKRNTAPAIALALKYIMEHAGGSEDEVVFVSPADHNIDPETAFVHYVTQAEKLALQGFLVTFGVLPSRPDTGFGYIKCDRASQLLNGAAHKVAQFVEKPNHQVAKQYVESGEYFWNAGMFAFSLKAMLDALDSHAPEIGRHLKNGYGNVLESFSEMPDISIDYAVMEKSANVAVLPIELNWSDVGSWDNVYEMLPKDSGQNAVVGDVVAIDTTNCLILGGKRLISTIGLSDLMVVETPDAVLIARRDAAQQVKQVVEHLKKGARKEATEHLTSHRPWGHYTVLDVDGRHKIKKIVVNPQQKLSLQMHYHRSEHWVVVHGSALVTVGDKETLVCENESIFVPKGATHRVENPGKVPLEIIEVQVGEYLGEDDIVRFEDVYGRSN